MINGNFKIVVTSGEAKRKVEEQSFNRTYII